MKPATKTFLIGMAAGFLATLVVAIAIAIVGSKIYSNHVEATLEERIGPPPVPHSLDAVYDWNAAPLGGTAIPMAVLRDKLVVLTFWKPDCFSCTEQLEYMQKLADELRDVTIEFAAVSIANASDTEQAIAMLDISLPVYLLKSERPEVFETKTLPTTFVLTPNGKIAFRYGGIARWDDPAVATYLRALAAENTLAP